MKALMLAATSSGSGKTTLTLGLLRALVLRNMHVQPYKVGPDYIDTAWHTQVSGVASRNLDAFMLPPTTLYEVFYRHLANADIGVIEGVMGLYDGFGSDPHYCSSAGLARTLNCPVILILDAHAVSTSVAATVMGFQQFDRQLNLAGVIVNRVNSEGHYQLLKSAIEKYCRIPVLGRLPTVDAITLPSRHLGLITAQEATQYDACWTQLAEVIEAHIDLDRLIEIAATVDYPPPVAHYYSEMGQQGKGLTLALAYDEAFNFYYQDNLDLLSQSGIEIVRFSPLYDTELPECDMVYLGGGYPELHARALAENHSMLASLRAAHNKHIPIYAECGGLMYLGDAFVDDKGQRYALSGVLPGYSTMTKKLMRFGYCEAVAEAAVLLAEKGQTLRGHEFHYSEFHTDLPAVFACHKTRDGEVQARWRGGYQVGNTLGSYLHLHFGQNLSLLRNWIVRARARKGL